MYFYHLSFCNFPCVKFHTDILLCTWGQISFIFHPPSRNFRTMYKVHFSHPPALLTSQPLLGVRLRHSKGSVIKVCQGTWWSKDLNLGLPSQHCPTTLWWLNFSWSEQQRESRDTYILLFLEIRSLQFSGAITGPAKHFLRFNRTDPSTSIRLRATPES